MCVCVCVSLSLSLSLSVFVPVCVCLRVCVSARCRVCLCLCICASVQLFSKSVGCGASVGAHLFAKLAERVNQTCPSSNLSYDPLSSHQKQLHQP